VPKTFDFLFATRVARAHTAPLRHALQNAPRCRAQYRRPSLYYAPINKLWAGGSSAPPVVIRYVTLLMFGKSTVSAGRVGGVKNMAATAVPLFLPVRLFSFIDNSAPDARTNSWMALLRAFAHYKGTGAG